MPIITRRKNKWNEKHPTHKQVEVLQKGFAFELTVVQLFVLYQYLLRSTVLLKHGIISSYPIHYVIVDQTQSSLLVQIVPGTSSRVQKPSHGQMASAIVRQYASTTSYQVQQTRWCRYGYETYGTSMTYCSTTYYKYNVPQLVNKCMQSYTR